MSTAFSTSGPPANHYVFSNSNKTIASGTSPGDSFVRTVATLTSTDKKWIAVLITTKGANDEAEVGFANVSASQSSYLGSNANSIGYNAGSGNVYYNGAASLTFGAPAAGEYMFMCFDGPNGKYYICKISAAGVRTNYNNSGTADPTANVGGTTGPTSPTTGAATIAASGYNMTLITAVADLPSGFTVPAGYSELGASAGADLTATQSLAIGQTASVTVQTSLTATQSLAIGQTATAIAPAHLTATQSLAIGQTATAIAPAHLTATQSLAIGQAATVKTIADISLTATQSLAIGQTATAAVATHLTATQSLAIGQTATAAALAQLTAAQSLAIGQAATVATTGGRVLTATQSLAIGQTATLKAMSGLHATQSLAIGQVATASVQPQRHLTATQSLSIGQVATVHNATRRNSLRTQVNQLNPIEVVTLFVLDTTPIGGSTILRFTPTQDPTGAPIVWQGHEFTPYPCTATGFEMASSGTLPRPAFAFSNISGVLGDFVANSPNEMLGASIARHRTLRKYLDGQPTADPSIEFPVDNWIVARKTAEDAMTITFECATMFDLEGIQLPRRQVIAGLCMFIYRGEECAYTGGPVQDINGNPTSNLAFDRCRKTLDACTARFGVKGPLHTSAFPASLLQVDAS